jgi:cobalamin biosynthesis Mg chelatase CobN
MALFLPAQAAAATPCWKKVLNDWSNGRAIGSYPLHCYRDAIRHLPEDLRDYSSASDDINAAMQAQIARRGTRSPQSVDSSSSSNGQDNGSGGTGGSGGGSGPTATRANAGPDRSAYRRTIDSLGTSNADSLPIPLLVLASVGALLLAAAAALGTTKRVRAVRATRRGPPPAA